MIKGRICPKIIVKIPGKILFPKQHLLEFSRLLSSRSINGYQRQRGNLQWTSIPCKGSSNTPSWLHATETGNKCRHVRSVKAVVFLMAVSSFSSPEATILLVSTKRIRTAGRNQFVEHAQSTRSIFSTNQICQIWREVRDSRTSGVGSRFLVLTKRIVASGDKNAVSLLRICSCVATDLRHYTLHGSLLSYMYVISIEFFGSNLRRLLSRERIEHTKRDVCLVRLKHNQCSPTCRLSSH